MTALAAALAATAMTTAAADAATVTLTGDNGAPVALTPGANLALRNMDADARRRGSSRPRSTTTSPPSGR